jgi:patatin-related protein
MNGGVSLAVWIGGVTMELSRLIRTDPEDDGLYGRLLRLNDATARVDVMAGASAGGLNGALLAMAIAHDRPIGGLRDLWLRQGSFTALMRSPTEDDPPSLLEGDGYFLPRLVEALGQLSEGPLTDPDEHPVHLILTTTLLNGQRLDFPDDYGSTTWNMVHRGQFRFARGELYLEGSPPAADPFADQRCAARLALAARSSASFPFAFEPSFVPVNDASSADRPDMAGHVNFRSSRFAMDGGVLVNKPLAPVLEAIYAQPAHLRPVRRVLAYVVPDPGVPPTDRPDEPGAGPTLAEVIAKVVSLPRVESLGESLEELARHRREVQDDLRARDALLRAIAPPPPATEPLGPLTSGLLDAHRRLVEDRWVDLGLTSIARERPPVLPKDRVRQGPSPEVTRAALRDAIRAQVAWSELGADAVAWDADLVEHAARLALDLVRRALAITPLEDPARIELGEPRLALHRILGSLRRMRRDDERAFANDPPPTGGTALEQADALAVWASAAVERSWTGRRTLLEPAVARLAEALERALPVVARVAAAMVQLAAIDEATTDMPALTTQTPEREAEGSEAERLAAWVAALDRPDEPALVRLLRIALVDWTTSNGEPVLAQPISDFVQISAYTPNAFDGRAEPSGKLNGVQLWHFGGFYKRSWRANDWMWGRLDAAYRLAQVLLDPRRLRRARPSNIDGLEDAVGTLLAEIRGIALGEGEETAALLASPRWRWDEERARVEVERLLSGDPDLRELTTCVRAVAKRLQIRIAAVELPALADAIEFDRDARAAHRPDALDFVRRVRAAETPGEPPRVALGAVDELMRSLTVGAEEVMDEGGSDLFLETATRATAVSLTAAQGARGGIGFIRPFASTLRALSLAVWGFAVAGARGYRVAAVASALALAIGGALIALSVLAEDPPQWVGVAGAAIVIAGVAVLALRLWSWTVAPTVIGVAVLAMAIAVLPPWLLEDRLSDEWLDTIRWVSAVAGIVLGAVLLGALRRGPLVAFLSILGLVAIPAGVILAVVLLWDRPTLLAAVIAGTVGVVVGGAIGYLIARFGRTG